jgi:hypothetical protein
MDANLARLSGRHNVFSYSQRDVRSKRALMTDNHPSKPYLPDDILLGFANHFDSLKWQKIQGRSLSPSEEEGVAAYEQLIEWLYPIPEIPKEIMDQVHEILNRDTDD